MVSVAQDVKWAFAGDKVTLEATGLTGDRARFKLTARPFDSSLPLYSANDQNYLQARGDTRCEVAPDVDGYYTITCLDEQVTANVKRYSNDGGAGLSKGIATATTLASASYTLTVGEVLTREMGHAPNTATMAVHAFSSGGTNGVLTYYAGAGYMPTLTGATTPAMEYALQTTAATSAMTFYGASSGSTYQGYMTALSEFVEAPADKYKRIANAFNKHITYVSSAVHDVADATNVMTAVGAPTTASGVVSYTNTMRGKVLAHFGLGIGASHPHGADTINTATVLAACTTLASAVVALQSIDLSVKAHRILNTSKAHAAAGDNTEASVPTWKYPRSTDSTSVVASYATSVAAAWDNHLSLTTISAGAYHAGTGSANAMVDRTPQGWEDLKNATNEALDKLEAHGANRVWDTGSAATYHSKIDASCIVPFRASDPASTVQALDYMLWVYRKHTFNGAGAGQWHGGSINNAAAAHVEPVGMVTRLQLALLDKLDYTDTAVPPNVLPSVNSLVSYGGFTPAT